MSELQDRIIRGLNAIMKAREKGMDTREWEGHLLRLIKNLEANKKVKVKMGRFGFCTCPFNIDRFGRGLCFGCYKVTNSCVCEQLEVNPEDVINQQFAQFVERKTSH